MSQFHASHSNSKNASGGSSKHVRTLWTISNVIKTIHEGTTDEGASITDEATMHQEPQSPCLLMTRTSRDMRSEAGGQDEETLEQPLYRQGSRLLGMLCSCVVLSAFRSTEAIKLSHGTSCSDLHFLHGDAMQVDLEWLLIIPLIIVATVPTSYVIAKRVRFGTLLWLATLSNFLGLALLFFGSRAAVSCRDLICIRVCSCLFGSSSFYWTLTSYCILVSRISNSEKKDVCLVSNQWWLLGLGFGYFQLGFSDFQTGTGNVPGEDLMNAISASVVCLQLATTWRFNKSHSSLTWPVAVGGDAEQKASDCIELCNICQLLSCCFCQFVSECSLTGFLTCILCICTQNWCWDGWRAKLFVGSILILTTLLSRVVCLLPFAMQTREAIFVTTVTLTAAFGPILISSIAISTSQEPTIEWLVILGLVSLLLCQALNVLRAYSISMLLQETGADKVGAVSVAISLTTMTGLCSGILLAFRLGHENFPKLAVGCWSLLILVTAIPISSKPKSVHVGQIKAVSLDMV